MIAALCSVAAVFAVAVQGLTSAGVTALKQMRRSVLATKYDKGRRSGYVIGEGTATRRFELKSTLQEAGAGNEGSATAYLRTFSVGSGVWETVVGSGEVTFTVYDELGDRYGTGRDDAGSGGSGVLGKCEWSTEAQRWEIYDLGCPPST